MKKLPIIAAFDFDGTITYRDSLFPFLLFTHGPIRSLFNFILCLPTLLGYIFGVKNRQQTKEKILERFYKGVDISKLGEVYAKKIKVRPQAIEKIRWHQSMGHRCVLVSASIDVYLKYWAAIWGFSDLLCSKFNEKTGKLIGKNCRAEEKVAQLTELLGPKSEYVLYAYGDSAGDKEMLELADFPFYRPFREKK